MYYAFLSVQFYGINGVHIVCAHQQTPSISKIFFILENGQELQNKKMQMNKTKKKNHPACQRCQREE